MQLLDNRRQLFKIVLLKGLVFNEYLSNICINEPFEEKSIQIENKMYYDKNVKYFYVHWYKIMMSESKTFIPIFLATNKFIAARLIEFKT